MGTTVAHMCSLYSGGVRDAVRTKRYNQVKALAIGGKNGSSIESEHLFEPMLLMNVVHFKICQIYALKLLKDM